MEGVVMAPAEEWVAEADKVTEAKQAAVHTGGVQSKHWPAYLRKGWWMPKRKKGVEFASVALYTLRTDSLVGGQLTETNGDFSLENLPLGGYNLKITYLGYNPVEQKVIADHG